VLHTYIHTYNMPCKDVLMSVSKIMKYLHAKKICVKYHLYTYIYVYIYIYKDYGLLGCGTV
jgi:hypothetical protein